MELDQARARKFWPAGRQAPGFPDPTDPLTPCVGKAAATSGGDVTRGMAWLDSALFGHGLEGRRAQARGQNMIILGGLAHTMVVLLTRGREISFPTTLSFPPFVS